VEGGDPVTSAPYISLDDGATWTQTTSKYVLEDRRAELIKGATGDLHTSSRSVISPLTLPPGISTAVATVPVSDGYFWDHKVLGVWTPGAIANKIIFLVPCSEECILWKLPRGSYVQGYHAAVENSNGDGFILAVSNSVEYLADVVESMAQGEEPWNHLIDGDCNIIAAVENNRTLRFVGTGPSPWGDQAPYLRSGNRLYVLDFFGRKIYPIELGGGRLLMQGRVWNSDLVLTEGWDVSQYDMGGQTSKPIGFPRKWGIPPSLINGASIGIIIDLIPYDDELFAIVVEPDEPSTTVYRYNGLGWHQFGKKMHGFFANHGFRVNFPLASGGLFTDPAQALIVPGYTSNGGIHSSTGWGYYQFHLPVLSHTPTVGVDPFNTSGARWYSGWMDGGFFDIDGTLLRMNIDCFFHGGTVLVEYRLDNDNDLETDAVWTSLVNADGDGAAFDADNLVLYFPNPDDPKRGIKYRTVQLRITLTRGAGNTNSPELRALTLNYLKTPDERRRYTFSIDINRMLEVGKTALDPFYNIDNEPPTMLSIWRKLGEFWTNDHVLLPLIIPNIEPDPGINVKIETKGMNFDDFRDAVGGQGFIQMAVLEPVV